MKLATLIVVTILLTAFAILIWLLLEFWLIVLSIGIILLGGYLLNKDEKKGIKKGKISSQVVAGIGLALFVVSTVSACTGGDDEAKEATANDVKIEQSELDQSKDDEKDSTTGKSKDKEKVTNQSTSDKNEKESSKNESINEQNAEKKKATQTSGTTDRIPVTLTKTVDGDTIKVNYNGQEETIRYLLIDTPESKHPNTCVQPYGQRASDRNKQLVNSGQLEIEFDVGERKDKYGRLLAYVYVDGKSVQETLLKEGLARVAYVYPPNTRYLDQFEKAEDNAENENVAIWKSNGYITDDGCAEQKEEQPKQKAQQPKQDSPSVYYKNCDAVRAAGAAPIKRGQPGYAKHLDRDGDGVGCES